LRDRDRITALLLVLPEDAVLGKIRLITCGWPVFTLDYIPDKSNHRKGAKIINVHTAEAQRRGDAGILLIVVVAALATNINNSRLKPLLRIIDEILRVLCASVVN
jgi:hypothetical protein